MEAYEALKLEANPKVVPFQPGDTVKVSVRIREGDRERLQAFQGIVTKERGIGPAKAFTVRRVTSGIGVERTFLIYSPNVESVDVIRRGKVKRAKLFYLRGLSSKESRIKERTAPAKAPKGRQVTAEPDTRQLL